MLADFFIALVLLVCFVCFASINLYNILVTHWRVNRVKSVAEVESPSGFIVGIAALGTGVYFVEAFLFQVLVFSGYSSVLWSLPLQLPSLVYAQFIGVVLTVTGYLLFVWSVRARGRFSVSWAMPEDQKLVTWGPYRFVRHPSYSGYFLMFVGFFLVWSNVFAVFPLFAILGYCRVSVVEEEFLVKRFGDVYRDYQSRTGRFVPRIRYLMMLF
jgi:protein-S-isoprenylcysteine O-methyltransferase Ste14